MRQRAHSSNPGRAPLAPFAGILLLFATSVGADEPETGNSTWYDTAQGRIAQSLDDSVTWFDEFFGDPRYEVEGEAEASLRITFDNFYSGVDGQSEYKVKARGYVSLPKFENRVRLVYSSDADAAISGEDAVENEPVSRGTTDDRDRGLGLSWLLPDGDNHDLSLGGGIKGGPDFYTKLRYRYTRPIEQNSRVRLTSTIYWITDDGAGFSNLLDYEFSRDKLTIWRYTLFGNYSEISNGLEWSTQGTWLRRLSPRNAISVRLGISGETDLDRSIKEYWTTFRFRRNFWRDWLFYELEPGLSWHYKADYDLEPTMALRLEVHF
ncbi:MAG: hypothetical protein P8Z31_10020 [Gammaproteobacteria bacterium]|jgi:hypothetical protein